MQRIFMALGLLLLAAVPAGAQQVTSIEIVEHGIYTAAVTNRQMGANGIGSGTVSDIRLALSTTTVPLQQGVKFGFRYHLSGAPDGATVQIRKVILFPPAGLTPPGKPNVKQIADTLQRQIGGTSFTDYGLDEPFELVPGKWTFQLWWGNRKLAEQSFTVVAH